jgi:hypothetical protein
MFRTLLNRFVPGSSTVAGTAHRPAPEKQEHPAMRRSPFDSLPLRSGMALCTVLAMLSTAPMAAQESTFPAGKWVNIFDGKSLEGWKSTNFGGEAEVKVSDGSIIVEPGSPLTGITYTGDGLPKTNYEVELEAQKQQGIDFFCALTFPVGDENCTFVVGGWAGSVVGLSSIDGKDASRNDTTQYMTFKKDQWYKIKVRVTPGHIEAWIDGKPVVKQALEGHKLSIRPEVELNRPLGICTFETRAALKNLKVQRLKESK